MRGRGERLASATRSERRYSACSAPPLLHSRARSLSRTARGLLARRAPRRRSRGSGPAARSRHRSRGQARHRSARVRPQLLRRLRSTSCWRTSRPTRGCLTCTRLRVPRRGRIALIRHRSSNHVTGTMRCVLRVVKSEISAKTDYEMVIGSLTALTDAWLGHRSPRSLDMRTTTRYRPAAIVAGSSVGPDRVPWASSIHASIVHMRAGSSNGRPRASVLPLDRTIARIEREVVALLFSNVSVIFSPALYCALSVRSRTE